MIAANTKQTPHHHGILRKIVKHQFLGILCLGVLAMIIIGVFCRVIVNGHSMDPTLGDGKHYLMLNTRWNPWISVHTGDIVVAKHEDGTIIKRVIAGPGDTLEIWDGNVYRNGSVLQEEYINEPMLDQDAAPITLEKGQYYLMGDNRNRSADSRNFGAFSEQSILGVLYLDAQPVLWILYGLAFLLLSTIGCSMAFVDEEDDACAK